MRVMNNWSHSASVNYAVVRIKFYSKPQSIGMISVNKQTYLLCCRQWIWCSFQNDRILRLISKVAWDEIDELMKQPVWMSTLANLGRNVRRWFCTSMRTMFAIRWLLTIAAKFQVRINIFGKTFFVVCDFKASAWCLHPVGCIHVPVFNSGVSISLL